MATQTYTSDGPTRRPSRRDILGAAGFSTLAGIAALAIAKPDAEAAEVPPGGAHPDARLIALADRFLAIDAHLRATDASPSCITDEEVSALIRKQSDLLDKMGALIATTAEGHRARARTFAAWHHLDSRYPDHIDRDRLWPILRDLIGEAA